MKDKGECHESILYRRICYGRASGYAHCSSICVTVGQEVKQGEVIGYVGTTGNSTGNHLHFEVWQNGERTDALGYFKAKE